MVSVSQNSLPEVKLFGERKNEITELTVLGNQTLVSVLNILTRLKHDTYTILGVVNNLTAKPSSGTDIQ